MNINIDEKYLAEIYYASRRVSLPSDSEFSEYTFFVPLENVSVSENGRAELIIDNETVHLKNRKNRAIVTVEQLQDVFDGKTVSKVETYTLKNDNTLETRLNYFAEIIPQEMRELPNWIVYRTRMNEEKGKKDKVLISAKDGRWAKSNDSTTWTDFETAKTYAIENKYEGLAFSLTDSGITCIDLDHAIKDGKLSTIAERCMTEFANTYIETSVSGNGLHIFIKDDILQKGVYKNRVLTADGEVEVYDNGRFISMTGNVRTSVNTLSDCPLETKLWLRNLLGKQKTYERRSFNGQHSSSDREIIEKILRSRKANDFKALYNGENLSGDHSRDDFKLLNILAFFTNGNTAQMERIFRDSKLYRADKGDKYLDISIRKAVSTLVFTPNDNSSKPRKVVRQSTGDQMKFNFDNMEER